MAVHRLRQRFGTILRLEIAETVLAPADVDDEVRELIRALSPPDRMACEKHPRDERSGRTLPGVPARAGTRARVASAI